MQSLMQNRVAHLVSCCVGFRFADTDLYLKNLRVTYCYLVKRKIVIECSPVSVYKQKPNFLKILLTIPF